MSIDIHFWHETYYYTIEYLAEHQPHTIAALAHRYAEGVAYVMLGVEATQSLTKAVNGAVDAGVVAPAHKGIVRSLAFEVARSVARGR